MALALRHRISALRDAVGQVDDRAAFIAREMLCVPLRPLVSLEARRRGSSAAEQWQRVGGRVGYLRPHRLRGLPPTWIRHGTADVFTIAEVLGRDHEYGMPHEAAPALPADRPPRVLDLGSNIGLFSLRAIRDLGAREIVAVEADSWNAGVLARNAHEARWLADWTVIEAFAAPDSSRTVAFAAGSFTESRAGVGVTTDVPTVDAFGLMAEADLMKVDIEGAEWALLADHRMASDGPPVIVLEYHRWGCPVGDDPGRGAETLLRAAGYQVLRAAPDGSEFGTLWAWRQTT